MLLVDDSIVRGTTSRQIIQLARAAGAAKVYFASAAPPVRYPNVYGIDMPRPEDLIAHGRSETEVAALIGADRLIYQDLDDLIASVREDNARLQDFDCSIFNGEYIAGRMEEPEEPEERDAVAGATMPDRILVHNLQLLPANRIRGVAPVESS